MTAGTMMAAGNMMAAALIAKGDIYSLSFPVDRFLLSGFLIGALIQSAKKKSTPVYVYHRGGYGGYSQYTRRPVQYSGHSSHSSNTPLYYQNTYTE